MSEVPEPFERWATRFEKAGLTGKAMLVGGTAVRFTAKLIDGALDRAASTVAETEQAFKRELDPNMEDAFIGLIEAHEKRKEAAA